jgi:preprotein translocase subunit SecG
MSARGAADLLTRATAILGTLFIVTSILLAVLAAGMHRGRDIDTSLAKPATAPTSGPGGLSIVPPVVPATTPATPTEAPAATTPIDQVPVAK